MASLISNPSPQSESSAKQPQFKELNDRITKVERTPLDHIAWNLALRCLNRTPQIFSNWKDGQDILDRLENQIPRLVETGQYGDASRVYGSLKKILATKLTDSAIARNYADYYSLKETEFMRRHELSRPSQEIINLRADAYELNLYYADLRERQWTMNLQLTMGGVTDPKKTISELRHLRDIANEIGDFQQGEDLRILIDTVRMFGTFMHAATSPHPELVTGVTFVPQTIYDAKTIYVNIDNHFN